MSIHVYGLFVGLSWCDSDYTLFCSLWVRTVCVMKFLVFFHLSHCMGKPTICIGENKGADQLRGNREADQRLCFRCTDRIILLLLKSEISSF